MANADPSVLAPGSVFQSRYEVVRCIKAGGMGAVYEVVHTETRRRRALKVMLPSIVANTVMRARFKLEATVAADVESEHIVETFDAGVDPESGAPFLVMELLRGEDLGATLERTGAMPPSQVVVLIGQIALALDKTHAAGIVHRDLKPDNLFLTQRDDGSPRIKILDFGIAKVVSDSVQTAQQTASIGTPLYMSPEQIHGDGKIGPRSDLYALGHIAFTLLTGQPYWFEEAAAAQAVYGLLLRVMNGLPEAPTARAARRGVVLPPLFDSWFARATAHHAVDRFENAASLVSTLAESLGLAAPRLSFEGSPQPSSQNDPGRLTPSVAASTGARVTPLGRTTSPVSTAGGAESKAPGSGNVAKVGLLLAVGAASLVGLYFAQHAFFGGKTSGTSVASPVLDASASAVPAASIAASTASPPTSATPVAEVSSQPSPPLNPGSKAEPATTKPSKSHNDHTATSPSATVAVAAPAPAPNPPAPSVAPSKPNNCSPPYFVDSNGVKHAKLECL
jgi:serine/threonine-protein kinase